MVKPDGSDLVFILSTPRAGSSLLGAILGSHPQVYCPPEPWFLLSLMGLRDNRLFVTAPYDHCFAQRAIQELLDEHLFNSAINAFAISIYGALLDRVGKRIFVDKTPRYYHILSALDEIFPNALKIWIKRNPLDVITSCKETWGLAIQELIGDALSPYTFDTTVSFPLLATYFDASDSKKFCLKYEDLVQDPTLHIKSLCSFLDLSYKKSMQDYSHNQDLIETYRRATMGDKKLLDHNAVHSRSVGRWRDLLTAQEVQQILLTLGTDVFRRLGYEGQLHDAMIRGELNHSDLSPDGKLPEVFKIFDQYAEATLEAKGLDLLQRADVQYTLLAHRSAQLEGEAEKRLQLIEQFVAQTDSLRDEQARLSASRREAADNQAAIRQLHQRQDQLATHLAQLERQLVEAASHLEQVSHRLIGAERENAHLKSLPLTRLGMQLSLLWQRVIGSWRSQR